MNPKFEKIIQRMVDMHAKKSKDYAQDANPYSNFEFAAAATGLTVGEVFRVMIAIKMARLRELEDGEKTANFEAVEDTRLDLAVYSALYASYYLELPTMSLEVSRDWAENILKEPRQDEIKNHSIPYPNPFNKKS